MPNGPVHRKFHLWLLFVPILVTIVGIAYFQPTTFQAFAFWFAITFGYWIGRSVDPDLDISRKAKGWWKGYALIAKLAGGHRSGFSHIPFLSTIPRFVWLMLPVIVGGLVLGIWETLSKDIELTTALFSALGGIYVGMGISDTFHIFLDAM